MEDLKKGPPPLPKDAFKQPNHEMESPWDAVSSAPAPKVVKPKLELPSWAGRPLAAHDHAQQLDLDAAVNEFGLKMPREQAEDEAYHQYLYNPSKGQHALAAHHHLAGMKAAHAAGDMDSARKHSLMYNMHAKALGHSPVDAARELASHIKEPAKVYRFKSHRGDAFAVNQSPAQENGVISSAPAPQLNKREREIMYMLYLMGNAALKKAEYTKFPEKTCPNCGTKHTPEKNQRTAGKKQFCPKCAAVADKKIESTDTEKSEKTFDSRKNRVIPCRCNAYHHPHRTGGGKCLVEK